ncbi:MAG: hypothetical protein RLZZ347_331 [Candidatus Parcubacteria bacterium]|jgi:hypothetical protein
MFIIPHSLPTSGRKGADKLKVLDRRGDFLQKRISEWPEKDRGYDKQELSALKWAIRQILTHEKIPIEETSLPSKLPQ